MEIITLPALIFEKYYVLKFKIKREMVKCVWTKVFTEIETTVKNLRKTPR